MNEGGFAPYAGSNDPAMSSSRRLETLKEQIDCLERSLDELKNQFQNAQAAATAPKANQPG
jgi:hypothetical protein